MMGSRKYLDNPIIGRFVPFLRWMPELRNGAVLRSDIVAGISVALVLIPQSMAYAQLAGLPPYYGLYAAFLPPLVAALFGSSRQLATGPVAIVSVMTAAAVAPMALAGSAEYVVYAVVLALLAGLIQVTLGLLRLGALINFLSHPVILGFTSAAAIIIATSQLNKVFGVTVERQAHHYETVWRTLQAAVTETHMPTLLMALLAISIMILLKRFYPKLPGVLIAVVVTTLLAWSVEFQKLRTVDFDSVASPRVKEAVDRQQALERAVIAMDQDARQRKQAYDEDVATLGAGHPTTLAAKFSWELAQTEMDNLQQQLKVSARQLRSYRLYCQTTDQGCLYLTAGEVPEDLRESRTAWRFDSLEGDRLTLRSGGRVVGEIPRGLPTLKLPQWNFSVVTELMVPALLISLIGFMEAISIAKAMATRTRQRLDVNQELVGQGLANITGSMFQSYATSGSFSRSAVNIGAGALTGFSSVVTSLIVAVTLLWFTPLLYHLPEATLAAVIMMAVMGLINIQPVKHAWKAQKHDGAVAVVTFLLTLVFAPHLELGILVGVSLSLILFLYRTMQPRAVELSRHQDGTLRNYKLFDLPRCDRIAMLRFEGSLYFANTSYFDSKVRRTLSAQPNLKFMIIDAVSINEMDSTGEHMLAELVQSADSLGVELLFTRFKKPIMDMFEQTGFFERFGRERFFRSTDQALEHCWELLGDHHEDTCPLRRPADLSNPT